ncbi:hypothetical protein NW762_005545 [Fusarium torreyae]|uniref:Uncharacterized protein n=1 Tax=Fusarium torreyae TaxID=1237075 RepID=A0A9W8VF03_9HYPO|nr:hypothetical protein NW762_005545 [Fusarium torreyae]
MSNSDLSASETSPGDPGLQDIAAKIDNYRKIMEAKLRKERTSPWKEHERNWESRLRVFHLDKGPGSHETPNLSRRSNPQHLWQDLGKALGEEIPKKPYQRLILLEGMDPRIAEALSIKLDIPSGFWAAHYI